MLEKPITRDKRAILIWLMFCVQLIALVVLIGGYTRLSGSGLSITQWKPIHGIIPPLNEAEWLEEFAGYQTTPQYRLINGDMSISGFKAIFWPEYIHRLLGRLIGISFALPLLIFALRKSITGKLLRRMIVILALGGLQGGIGWIMVKSGLQDAPYVSHTKLALHLSLAFSIFAMIIWTVFDIADFKKPDKQNYVKLRINNKNHLTLYKIWFAALCVQIIFGAFMAGLHAGLVYNTWPTMNGEFIPDELFNSPHNDAISLAAKANHMLQNITFIQFIHRSLAILLSFGFLFWWYLHKEYIRINNLGKGCALVSVIIFTQFILGVITLLYHVPLPIALAHHFTALILWFASIYLLYSLSYYNKNIKQLELVK